MLELLFEIVSNNIFVTWCLVTLASLVVTCIFLKGASSAQHRVIEDAEQLRVSANKRR